ncbi:MAG: hypothetical protein PHY80_02055 [Rickettsiales bacterium]|nr:hypothetical protein [Rickettsiales bacterium]MDD2839891.1 hypothetical protein [Rickettsiales bacterium]
MKKEELKIINQSINQLNNLKKIKEEEIRKEENDSEKEIEDEVGNDCDGKITFEERIVLGKEIQKLIEKYSKYKYDYDTFEEFNKCHRGFSRKLFKIKIFELSSVIIKKYIDVNEEYFGLRHLETLVRILDRILKIDYRKEKESMSRIKALIKFCKID